MMKANYYLSGWTGLRNHICLAFFLVFAVGLIPGRAFPAEKQETAEIMINKGILNSEKGDWVKAKVEFEKAVELAPDSEIALNYLGQACYQVGDFEKASQIFRRLLEKSPDQPEYHLSLGLALLKLGNKEEAQKEFDLAESAPGLKGKPRFWRARLSTGTQYDSNLILSPRDSDVTGALEDKWGMRQVLMAFGEVSHSFVNRTRSGLSYTYYQAFNFDLGQEGFNPREYDIENNTFGFSTTWEGKKYLARLAYSYDLLLAGSSLDLYSQTHGVTPSINYLITPKLISYLGYEFRRDIYRITFEFPEEVSQDGMSHALSLRQYILLGPENRITIAPEYRFKANQAEGSDFEYMGHRAKASFDLRYRQAVFSLAGDYEFRDFANINSESQLDGDWVKRQDHELGLKGSLGWASGIWGVELGMNLTEVFSNIEKYSYQRLLLMLSLNLTV